MRKEISLTIAVLGLILPGCGRPELRGLDLVGQVPSRAAAAECAPKAGAAAGAVCEKRTDLGRVLAIERFNGGGGGIGQSIVLVRTEQDKALARGLLRGILPEESEASAKTDRSLLAPDVRALDEGVPGVSSEQARLDLGDRFAVVYKSVSLKFADGMTREDRDLIVHPRETAAKALPPPDYR
jgi:hypothetical protein